MWFSYTLSIQHTTEAFQTFLDSPRASLNAERYVFPVNVVKANVAIKLNFPS